VPGTGPVVGEAIVKHELVDMVSFTGSTRAGRRVAELAAAAPKRTSLELGGKSASVLLDDLSADEMGNAVAGSLTGCLINSARPAARPPRCSSRATGCPRSRGLLEVFAQFAPVGDPMSPDTQQGPLVSKVQQERVRSYISDAIAEGAKLVAGGPEQPENRRPASSSSRRCSCRGRHDHRAGGGLRTGPDGGAVRRRRRGGARDRERHAVRPVRCRCGRRTRTARSPSRSGCAPARSASTAACSTRPRRSAASGRAATGASSGSLGIEEFTTVTSLQL
jgi:hypothetical protein